MSGTPSWSNFVDWPMSRLSKRTTWWPRAASSGAEVVVPADHLRAQTHDQQQRRVHRIAEGVAGQLDAVGRTEAWLGVHGQGRLSRGSDLAG
jgi:hypothetical protein